MKITLLLRKIHPHQWSLRCCDKRNVYWTLWKGREQRRKRGTDAINLWKQSATGCHYSVRNQNRSIVVTLRCFTGLYDITTEDEALSTLSYVINVVSKLVMRSLSAHLTSL
jgi:hypothetical protein